jgi:hypothetical protein
VVLLLRWSITQPLKGRKSCHLLQCAWTLRTQCSVKRADTEGLYSQESLESQIHRDRKQDGGASRRKGRSGSIDGDRCACARRCGAARFPHFNVQNDKRSGVFYCSPKPIVLHPTDTVTHLKAASAGGHPENHRCLHLPPQEMGIMGSHHMWWSSAWHVVSGPFFWWDWGLNSGLHNCKARILLEPHLHSILLWFFWRWGSHKLFAQAGLNCSPPNLSLPSSWDYKCESLPLACKGPIDVTIHQVGPGPWVPTGHVARYSGVAPASGDGEALGSRGHQVDKGKPSPLWL